MHPSNHEYDSIVYAWNHDRVTIRVLSSISSEQEEGEKGRREKKRICGRGINVDRSRSGLFFFGKGGKGVG